MKRKFVFFSLVVVLLCYLAYPKQTEAAGVPEATGLSYLVPALAPLLTLPGFERPSEAKMLPSIPHGAIIVGAMPYTPTLYKNLYGYWIHSAIYDAEKNVFISATPENGVRYEDPAYWMNNYEDVAIVTVNNVKKKQLQSILNEAHSYIGLPYAFTPKDDLNGWYCSKLPWYLFKKWADLDLDPTNDYFVTPDDLFNDDDVTLYWRG